MNSCPECKNLGRKISQATIQSQTSFPFWSSQDDWFFCKTSDCSVAYFSSSEIKPISLNSLKETPFPKSTNPNRLVCFCFHHTVQEVLDDVLHNSTSTIKADIIEACRKDLSDCLHQNPEGRCCLGNISMLLKTKQKEESSCCSKNNCHKEENS